MKISEIIETYIENQNKINKLNDNLKQLKENNKKISDTILHFMENNKKNDISYKNNIFEKKQTLTHSGISQKLLKNSITNYFKKHNINEEKIDDLIQYILNNREKTQKNELKVKTN